MKVERYQLFDEDSGRMAVAATVAIQTSGQQVLKRRLAPRSRVEDLVCNSSHRHEEVAHGIGADGLTVAEEDRTAQDNSTDGQTNNKMSPNSRLMHYVNCFFGVAIRLAIYVIFVQLERSFAFKRKIHPEELWLYKNPPTSDYVPASVLLPASFIVPFIVIILHFLITNDKRDFSQGANAITLSLGLNGLLTSLLKIVVGRPRPDFFYRCFPDGKMINDEFECTGDLRVVNEGRKSFPSGHSSFAFAGFGFVFLYLAAKLHVFNERGRGQTWRFCLSITPLVVAMLVAISRTCDYHHHWQDVTVGSVLGMFITYVVYRQYFPSIFASNAHRPYSARKIQSGTGCITSIEEDGEQKPLINDDKETKWI